MKKLNLKTTDKQIYQLIKLEEKRQAESIELIPSENYTTPAVLETLGSVLTNKYSEGYPGKRYYGGQINIDKIEQLAIDRAKKLFHAEHANVQPLSGAAANLAAYFALLKPGDTVLGMDLSHGGHLTHGHPVTHIANIFKFFRYKTNAQGEIDLNNLRQLALKHRPQLILVGYSAYTRNIDYHAIKKIATEVGAKTMADIAHIAGLIATEEMENPVPIFDVVTCTTHKTLRGPRGGMIMSKKEYASAIDRSVFPGLQGGPHQNNIAAKAVAFELAAQPEFKQYAKQVLLNAKVLEKEFVARGYQLCFGGTDNHLLLIDLTNKKITGRQAQEQLDSVGISVNKNTIPDDPRPSADPSGIRLGTPAVTTRGMKEKEMVEITKLIDAALTNKIDSKKLAQQVKVLARKFPLSF